LSQECIHSVSSQNKQRPAEDLDLRYTFCPFHQRMILAFSPDLSCLYHGLHMTCTYHYQKQQNKQSYYKVLLTEPNPVRNKNIDSSVISRVIVAISSNILILFYNLNFKFKFALTVGPVPAFARPSKHANISINYQSSLGTSSSR